VGDQPNDDREKYIRLEKIIRKSLPGTFPTGSPFGGRAGKSERKLFNLSKRMTEIGDYSVGERAGGLKDRALFPSGMTVGTPEDLATSEES